MARAPDQYTLTPENINENVKKTVYAVRGELYLRAAQLQAEGKEVRAPIHSRNPLQTIPHTQSPVHNPSCAIPYTQSILHNPVHNPVYTIP